MKSLIVGNWKLYVPTLQGAKKLFRDIDKSFPRGVKSTVVVCPPTPFVALMRDEYGGKKLSFGAQDAFYEVDGAHTGMTSPRALRSADIEYVILGHAEVRAQGETSETVSKKVVLALEEKLHPIICLGESVRDSEGLYLSEIERMVSETLSRVESSNASKITIAYEPVWAIGGAAAPEPRTASETMMFIRKTLADMWGREKALKVRIIYGGAVDTENAERFKECEGIQGLLVGRASTDAKEFVQIIKAWS